METVSVKHREIATMFSDLNVGQGISNNMLVCYRVSGPAFSASAVLDHSTNKSQKTSRFSTNLPDFSTVCTNQILNI